MPQCFELLVPIPSVKDKFDESSNSEAEDHVIESDFEEENKKKNVLSIPKKI